jgi:hypothetical protein
MELKYMFSAGYKLAGIPLFRTHDILITYMLHYLLYRFDILKSSTMD